MEDAAPPSASAQKLRLRRSTRTTLTNEDCGGGALEPSNAPRGGSRTVSLKSGAMRSPASPTAKKATRQLTWLAMTPPMTTPAAPPIGMPKEYAPSARARWCCGKKSQISE